MRLLGIIALLLVVLIVFIALLVVLYRNFNSRLISINEKLTGAKEEFDDKYDKVFKSLLGSSIIIDNMDNAVEFSRATGYSTKRMRHLREAGQLSGSDSKRLKRIIDAIK